MARYTLKSFGRYVLVGLLNTGFGYSLFSVLLFLGFEHLVALVASTALSTIFNFFTTGKLVFGNSSFRVVIRYIEASLLLLGGNALLLGKVTSLGVGALFGQVLCLSLVVPAGFCVMRLWVFTQESAKVS